MTPPDHTVTLREFFDEKFLHLDRRLDQGARDLNLKVDHIIRMQNAAASRIGRAERRLAVLSWAYGVGIVVLGWIVVEIVRL